MAMRRLKGHDDVELVTSERVMTREGFLRAPGRISRTGIQEYSKLELGLGASHDIVRLYRPPEEVFADESLATAHGATMVYGHPDGDVTSKNYRGLSTGDAMDPVVVDPYVQVTITIKDEWAIYALIDGVEQLSCGYAFDYDETPGTTPEGEPYDAIMRSIRINHIAQVYAARCGAGCNIADAAHRPIHDKAIGRKTNDAERKRLGLTAHDSAPCGCGGNKHNHDNPGDSTMATKPIKVGMINLALEGTTADVVEAFVADAAKAATDSKSALDAANAKAAGLEKELAEERARGAKAAADHAVALDALQKQIPSAAQLEALVADRTAVIGKAKAIAADVDPAGKSAHEVRVAALTIVLAQDGVNKAIASAVLRGADLAKAEPAFVESAFDAVVAAGAADTSTRDFQSGLGAALAGKGETPTPAADDTGAPAQPKLTGYARTLQKLNEKPNRAAT